MGKTKDTKKAPKKHKKLKKAILAVVLILIAAFVLTLVGNIVVNRNFEVSFYQITSEKVSDNIRIIELSDLHNSEYGKNNSKLIAKIKSLHPDLIVYAGDMMNEQDSNYSVMFDLSDKLSEIAPIYACYGNNELDQQLFFDKTFKDQLKEHHINLLSNEAKDVEVKNSVLQLVAISDNVDQFDVETNNAKKFINSIEPTDNCRICLTHYPELFNEKLLNKNIDIAFTGHAHGGHVRLPYVGGLFSPGEGFLPKFTAGVVEAEDGTQVVVSRGLGNSSEATGIKGVEIPRINNQPELVVVDICWY
ncbi:MAG: metallophosphoesterase family protein [Eubacterium sp.]|nr:metallophosphoesterase family protein [Eubacterium sp.]